MEEPAARPQTPRPSARAAGLAAQQMVESLYSAMKWLRSEGVAARAELRRVGLADDDGAGRREPLDDQRILVIAKTHATELYQLSEPEATQYFRDMLRVAEAIANSFKPRKLNYELLGNTVPHLHWHIFPRYDGDPNPARPVWEHAHAARVPTAEEAAVTIAANQRGL